MQLVHALLFDAQVREAGLCQNYWNLVLISQRLASLRTEIGACSSCEVLSIVSTTPTQHCAGKTYLKTLTMRARSSVPMTLKKPMPFSALPAVRK